MAIIVVTPGVRLTLGTPDSDTIVGTPQAEEIRGLDGNDSIVGNDGSDTLYGNIGSDTLEGGAGNDSLFGGQNEDLLRGGAGDDRLFGNKGKDFLFGEVGNDSLYGGQDDDYVEGGEGNDVLLGDFGNDTLVGGPGNDIFVIAPGRGTNILKDFVKGQDKIGLQDILFSDLRIVQDGVTNVATIFSASGEQLAILENFNSVLGLDDFTSLLSALDTPVPPVNPSPILPGAPGNLGVVIDRLSNFSPYFGNGRSTFTRNLSDPQRALIENFQVGNDLLQLGDSGPFVPELFRITTTPPRPNLGLVGINSGALEFNYNGSGQTRMTGLTSIPQPNQVKLGTVVAPNTPPSGNFVATGTFQQTGSLMIGSGAIDASGSVGGNDIIVVNGENGARVIAGPGNDSVVGANTPETGDTIFGGEGNDTVRGLAGDDSLEGGNGNDLLAGGSGDDVLLGQVGADTLLGGAGNDTLDGGAGEDLLEGETGNDYLVGGEGNDTLRGGAGSDTLVGDSGDDILDGGSGSDTLFGGPGRDGFVIPSTAPTSGDVNTLADFNPAEDYIVFDGDPRSLLISQVGADTVISYPVAGQSPQAAVRIVNTNANAVAFSRTPRPATPPEVPGGELIRITTLFGLVTEPGVGFNTGVMELRRSTTAGNLPVRLNLGGTAVNGVDYTMDVFDAQGNKLVPILVGTNVTVTIPNGENAVFLRVVPIEEAIGEQPPETIVVSVVDSLGYRISVENPAATVQLLDSPDTGDVGNVTFFPGTPVDDIVTGSNAAGDRLFGGPGNDILNGLTGDDALNGGPGNDVLSGGQGDDSIDGGVGNDDLRGDEGNDILQGQAGRDTLNGGAGNDILDGGPGNDLIFGGPGNDTIVGGLGADTIFGERDLPGGFTGNLLQNALVPGNLVKPGNRFVFNAPTEATDLIADFASNLLVDGNSDGVFNANTDFVFNDVIVLNGPAFGLTTSNTIAPAEFQNAFNVPGIAVQPTARVLYLQGGFGVNGLVYYTPTGITAAGQIPVDAVLLAELTSPTGTASPSLTEEHFQVLPFAFNAGF